MARTFVISDTHFFHDNLLEMNNHRAHMGSTVEEMNEYLIQQWNSVVSDEDTVYHLGDFTFKQGLKRDEIIKIGEQLKGHKILILGNHDRHLHRKKPDLFHSFGFEVIHEAPVTFNRLILSHEPVSTWDLKEASYNIHGHLHEKVVQTGVLTSNHEEDPIPLMDDYRYINVSVERLLGSKPVEIASLVEYKT